MTEDEEANAFRDALQAALDEVAKKSDTESPLPRWRRLQTPVRCGSDERASPRSHHERH